MSQGGHFYYRRTGEACYEIRGANGAMRTPTLRDAKKGIKGVLMPYEIVPSVTTINKSLGLPPSLANWMVRNALECAATNPPQEGEDADAYYARIAEDSRRQGKEAAELGTAVHSVLEAVARGKPVPDVSDRASAIARPAVEWLMRKAVSVERVEETFAVDVYGGRVDIGKVVLGDKRTILLDFKTQNTNAKYGHKTRAYDEWGEQVIAYADAMTRLYSIKYNAVVCLAMSTSAPGAWGLHEWREGGEMERLRKRWHHKLRYYQYVNSWWPPQRADATGETL